MRNSSAIYSSISDMASGQIAGLMQKTVDELRLVVMYTAEDEDADLRARGYAVRHGCE